MNEEVLVLMTIQQDVNMRVGNPQGVLSKIQTYIDMVFEKLMSFDEALIHVAGLRTTYCGEF